MSENSFKVIRDTREKEGHGYWYEPFGSCDGTIVAKVDVGDYTIEGLEDKVCIERKKSTSELAKNCTEKRFYKELERMSYYKYKFIILEFSWADVLRFPQGAPIKYKGVSHKLTANHLVGLLLSAQMRYGISVIPCGNEVLAEHTVLKILEKCYKYETET